MKRMFPEKQHPCLRFFIGDVRDYERLKTAFTDVDYVIHAAALKEVDTCEKEPREAILTNVMGAINVQRAAIECGVRKVVAVSTDKAASPITTYGATKLLSDKSFVRGNVYAAGSVTRFAVVRYGNVACSRGSVIPVFAEQRKTGELTITDPKMTRFWLSMPQAVEAVLHAFEVADGGEVVIPKMRSFTIMDLAHTIAPKARFRVTGIRICEKMHEQMWGEDEWRQVYDLGDYYVMYPDDAAWEDRDPLRPVEHGKRVEEGFTYSSRDARNHMSADEIRIALLKEGVECG
jgi:UDP-N-acetylglucosamine 4,6-dehydratase